jgi:hypothetical protein
MYETKGGARPGQNVLQMCGGVVARFPVSGSGGRQPKLPRDKRSGGRKIYLG